MKKLKLLLMLLMVGILSSGCIKFNVNMDIKKDKSMDFTIIYAIDKTYSNGENSIKIEDYKDAEKQGFKVESYQEGSMEGIKLTKNIKNIDEVSTEKDTVYSLSGIMENNDNTSLFKVEKGLFKNTYTAKFTFDANESGLTDDDTLGDEVEDTDDEILFDNNNLDLTSMTSNLDLTFNVKLPYKAISNNATKIDDNNKKLSWSLTTTGNDTIDFTFSLYNMTLIYICIGIFVLIVAVVIVVISKKKNKKENNNSLEENPEVIKKTIDSEE